MKIVPKLKIYYKKPGVLNSLLKVNCLQSGFILLFRSLSFFISEQGILS